MSDWLRRLGQRMSGKNKQLNKETLLVRTSCQQANRGDHVLHWDQELGSGSGSGDALSYVPRGLPLVMVKAQRIAKGHSFAAVLEGMN